MITQIIKSFRSAVNFSAHNEVALFRELAESIQANSKSVFIDETHGPKKCNVYFTNCLGKKNDRCEISDLLIVTFISKDKPLRATFWQAKKEPRSEWASSKSKVRQLDFNAQFNQWDLLARRPKISGAEKFFPPEDLLSGATSSSIGSFGTFYERNGRLEVFHSVAEFVSCKNPNAKHPSFISNGLLDGYKFAHQEAITRVKLRAFLEALFRYEIGSLLLPQSPSGSWLAKYAQSKVSQMGAQIDPDFFSLYDQAPFENNSSSFEDGVSVLLVHAARAV